MTENTLPTIVLIDDDIFLLGVYSKYLQEHYHVVPFEQASEALLYLRNNTANLVISDIEMPEMNGLDLRKTLSDNPDTDIIPFVFLTSHQEDTVQDKAVVLGIDDFLIKPIDKKTILTTCQRVIKRAFKVRNTLGNKLDTQITSSLRPELPAAFGQFRVAVDSRSAEAGGGDFIVYKNHDNKHFLTLGDIMGHGVQAKFFAHAYAGYVSGRLAAIDASFSPASVLGALSDQIKDNALMKNSMITCLACCLSDEGILCSGAGHPAPCIISQEGVIELDIGGLIPGLVRGYQYKESPIELKSNERLLLITDGFYDAFEDFPGQKEQVHLLRRRLVETLALDIENAVQSVMELFDELTNKQPLDDATIVLLENKF